MKNLGTSLEFLVDLISAHDPDLTVIFVRWHDCHCGTLTMPKDAVDELRSTLRAGAAARDVMHRLESIARTLACHQAVVIDPDDSLARQVLAAFPYVEPVAHNGSANGRGLNKTSDFMGKPR